MAAPADDFRESFVRAWLRPDGARETAVTPGASLTAMRLHHLSDALFR